MTTRPQDGNSLTVVDRLVRTANDHDLDGLVACFADDYENETPAHPERGFRGSDQVRRNWTRIFAAVPDLSVQLLGTAVGGDTVWTEWEHRGTRLDGDQHLLRGVILFTVVANTITRARFYLEPVDQSGGGVNDTIDRMFGARSRASGKDPS